MNIYVAAIKIREMRESARESEVRMTMCVFGTGCSEALPDVFASGSVEGSVASAGAGSCNRSGADSEFASSSTRGEDGVGAAWADDCAGEVSAMLAAVTKNNVCAGRKHSW